MQSPDTIANQSPGAQHAANSGTGSIYQFLVAAAPKLAVFLLAISVAVNVVCGWFIFTAERETRLKEYDLMSFKSDEFSPLKAQADQMQRELDAIRIQLALRQELRK